jgi:hypothetical protein
MTGVAFRVGPDAGAQNRPYPRHLSRPVSSTKPNRAGVLTVIVNVIVNGHKQIDQLLPWKVKAFRNAHGSARYNLFAMTTWGKNACPMRELNVGDGR